MTTIRHRPWHLNRTVHTSNRGNRSLTHNSRTEQESRRLTMIHRLAKLEVHFEYH